MGRFVNFSQSRECVEEYCAHYSQKFCCFQPKYRSKFTSFRFWILFIGLGLSILVISAASFALRCGGAHRFSENENNVLIKEMVGSEISTRPSTSETTNVESKRFPEPRPPSSDIEDKFFTVEPISTPRLSLTTRKLLGLKNHVFHHVDVEETFREVKTVSSVILQTDQLKQQKGFPIERCSQFIDAQIHGGIVSNESDDFSKYCKIILVNYILGVYHERKHATTTTTPATTTTTTTVEPTKATELPLFAFNPPPFFSRKNSTNNFHRFHFLPTISPTFASIRIPVSLHKFPSYRFCENLCGKNPSLGGHLCHCDSPPLLESPVY